MENISLETIIFKLKELFSKNAYGLKFQPYTFQTEMGATYEEAANKHFRYYTLSGEYSFLSKLDKPTLEEGFYKYLFQKQNVFDGPDGKVCVRVQYPSLECHAIKHSHPSFSLADQKERYLRRVNNILRNVVNSPESSSFNLRDDGRITIQTKFGGRDYVIVLKICSANFNDFEIVTAFKKSGKI